MIASRTPSLSLEVRRCWWSNIVGLIGFREDRVSFRVVVYWRTDCINRFLPLAIATASYHVNWVDNLNVLMVQTHSKAEDQDKTLQKGNHTDQVSSENSWEARSLAWEELCMIRFIYQPLEPIIFLPVLMSSWLIYMEIALRYHLRGAK